MKILLVNSVFNFGSTGRICTALRDYAAGQGQECRCAVGRYAGGADYRLASRLSVGCDILQTRLFDGCGGHSDGSYKKLVRIIEEYRPDIVHLHNLHGYYINAYALLEYLKARRIPTLLTLHDTFWLTGHCAFLYGDCDRWKIGCHDCPHLRDYPKTYARDNTARLWEKKKAVFEGFDALSLSVPSLWLRGLLPDSILSVLPSYHIQNGINADIFHPSDAYAVGEKKILLGAANDWGAHKGLADFITLRSLLGDDFEIRLAGLDRETKLPEGMTALGALSPSQLADEYRGAYMFVNLSHADNLPLTICEALCCGTPVVTYDIGGCREPLSDGAGMTAAVGDTSGIAEAIKTVNRAAAAEKALAAADGLSMNSFCEKTYALYAKILSGNNLI